jgi:hypothetical protein
MLLFGSDSMRFMTPDEPRRGKRNRRRGRKKKCRKNGGRDQSGSEEGQGENLEDGFGEREKWSWRERGGRKGEAGGD